MTAVQHEQVASTLPKEAELPVFAASDDRRARKLRRVVLAAAGLACLWLGGLGIGMVGLENLPRTTAGAFDRIAGRQPAPDRSGVERAREAAARAAAAAVADRAVAQRETAAEVARRSAVRPRAAQRPAATPARQRPVRRASPVTAPAPPAAPLPPATPTPRQGWARRGYTVAPGQARQTETTPPPPPGERGRRLGQQPTTTTTLPPPPPPGKSPHEPKK